MWGLVSRDLTCDLYLLGVDCWVESRLSGTRWKEEDVFGRITALIQMRDDAGGLCEDGGSDT